MEGRSSSHYLHQLGPLVDPEKSLVMASTLRGLLSLSSTKPSPIQIKWGLFDEQLLELIDTINNLKVQTHTDQILLRLAWDRLDLLTSS